MSTPPILNNVFFFRDLEQINDLFAQLSAQDQDKKRPRSSKGDVKVETKAGIFHISRAELGRRVDEFMRWDSLEPESEKDNGKISFETAREQIWKKRDPKSTTIKYGVGLHFNKFIPSDDWAKNKSRLEAAFQKGDIVFDSSSQMVLKDPSELWQIATAATLAGFTPELFDLEERLCNPTISCGLKYFVKENDSWSSIIKPAKKPAKSTYDTYRGLVSKTDVSDSKIGMLHERGHFIMRKSAETQKAKRFAFQLVANAQAVPQYQKAAKFYRNLYENYHAIFTEIKKACNDNLECIAHEDRAGLEVILEQMNYIIEEMCDVPYLKNADPSLEPAYKMRYSDSMRQLAGFTPEKIKSLLYDSPPLLANVLYSALYIVRWRNLGDQEGYAAAYEQEVRAALQGESQALELLDAFISLGNYAKEYINEPAFKAIANSELKAILGKELSGNASQSKEGAPGQ